MTKQTSHAYFRRLIRVDIVTCLDQLFFFYTVTHQEMNKRFCNLHAVKTGKLWGLKGYAIWNISWLWIFSIWNPKLKWPLHVFMLRTIPQPQDPFSRVIQMRSAILWLLLLLDHWSCLNQFSFSKNNALILDFINSSSFVFLISSSPNILFSSWASCCFPAPPCNMWKKFSSPCLGLVKILLFLFLQKVICRAQRDKGTSPQTQTGVQLYFCLVEKEWLPFWT